MTPSVTCYAQPDKAKSQRVIEAFAAGCGGTVASTYETTLRPGAAVFYGVRPKWFTLWEQAKSEGRNWYYIDNAYFDDAREQKFRVCCNYPQQFWFQDKPYPSFSRTILPWRTSGDHIVLCAQSDEYMRVVEAWKTDWVQTVSTALRKYTARKIVVRRKAERIPLHVHLQGAWALVTHTSAAANEALVAGVPVFVTGRCAALTMSGTNIAEIENPRMPSTRAAWAAAVAAHQWTLEEMAQGKAWRTIKQP